MIVDTIVDRNGVATIKFKNTMGDSNQPVELPLDPRDDPHNQLNPKFYFVHLKLKSS